MLNKELRKLEDDMGKAFYADVVRLEDRVKRLEATLLRIRRIASVEAEMEGRLTDKLFRKAMGTIRDFADEAMMEVKS